MKQLLYLISLQFFLASCKHADQRVSYQKEEKIIGPSISEIVAIYKKNNANMVTFLKEESEPILDPSKYAIMKANLEVTKGMSEEELQALTDYMYSVAK